MATRTSKQAARNTKTAVKADPANTTPLRLQYYRSAICTPTKHKRVVKGLGFTRLNQVVERENTDSIRGMVNVIPHLVRILD
jgi:large subunit ribosomal protein L30